MRVPLFEVVEGWTGALPFTLTADETPVNLTAMTVSVVLKNVSNETVLDSTAGVTITSSTAGQGTFSPSSSHFVAAQTPYRIRVRAVDALSKVVYFPNGDEDVIVVNVI